MQRDEVAHLAAHGRHPDLEPALGAAVAVAHPDHDRAAPAGDPPDPVARAQVVDVEVERSRLHPATERNQPSERLGAASTIAAVIALTAGIALLIGWYRGFNVRSLELAAAVFVVILAFQIVVLVLIGGDVGLGLLADRRRRRAGLGGMRVGRQPRPRHPRALTRSCRSRRSRRIDRVKLRRNAKIELLRAVPLFSGCSSKELGQISALGDELHQPAGSELITEGVKGREFFVLIDGTVEARRKGRRVATLRVGRLLRRDRAADRVTAHGDGGRRHPRSPARDLRPVVPAAPRRHPVDPGEGAQRARRADAADHRLVCSSSSVRRRGPEWDPSLPLEEQSDWHGPRRLHGRARGQRVRRARRAARRRGDRRAGGRGSVGGRRARDARARPVERFPPRRRPRRRLDDPARRQADLAAAPGLS